VNRDTVLTNEHCCSDSQPCDASSFVIARYRGSLREVAAEETFVVARELMRAPELDVVALQLEGAPGDRFRPVAMARGRQFQGAGIYVVGHPRGRPLESSMGILFAYRDEITFTYPSGPKRKTDQILYWAAAEPGSSGSPIFSLDLAALVGIHHSGGISPDAIGILPAETDGFTHLLAGSDSEAIASALEAHGIEFESL
jgi:V8-like Glu-specific endopeptidase